MTTHKQVSFLSAIVEAERRDLEQAACIAAELQDLLDQGAMLAVTPDQALCILSIEQSGGVVDLETGAVSWPGGA